MGFPGDVIFSPILKKNIFATKIHVPFIGLLIEVMAIIFD